MRQTQWIQVGDSFFFLEQIDKEWRKVGEVHRRKIYQALPESWHAFIDFGQPGRWESRALGRFDTHFQAQVVLEGAHKLFSEGRTELSA